MSFGFLVTVRQIINNKRSSNKIKNILPTPEPVSKDPKSTDARFPERPTFFPEETNDNLTIRKRRVVIGNFANASGELGRHFGMWFAGDFALGLKGVRSLAQG